MAPLEPPYLPRPLPHQHRHPQVPQAMTELHQPVRSSGVLLVV